jgi:hypothetical protein
MTDSSGTVTLRTVSWRPTRRTTARMMPSWRAWVSSILDRYVRRAARAGGADRVLARPLTFVRERWLFASRTFLPQIHLAIQPVLRPRLWQARQVRASSASSDIRAKRANAGSALDRGPHTLAQAALATPHPGSPETASRALPSPFELVFQRLRDPERAIGATSGAKREEGLAARTVIARRFSAKSRRVEQAPADAPARVIARTPADGPARSNARHEAPPSIVSAAEPPAAWATRTPDGRWHGSRAGIPTAPQPNVNIAAIADRVMQQIDDRLHAWQERTGF